jgi:hypothetical protein
VQGADHAGYERHLLVETVMRLVVLEAKRLQHLAVGNKASEAAWTG